MSATFLSQRHVRFENKENKVSKYVLTFSMETSGIEYHNFSVKSHESESGTVCNLDQKWFVKKVITQKHKFDSREW